MRDHGYWTNFVVDDQATPPPLPDERYRTWLSRQRIFISSVMDDELTPYRQAVQDYLQQTGGNSVPVMWETVTPQDKAPERAYLDGVDQATLFVLVLGQRYGVTDGSGYSPTHKEANRAKERHLPRLLFTLDASDRDGRLNDWLRSLYNEVSGTAASKPEDLIRQLDGRLRELAARSERSWIKLGNYIFPGTVSRIASAQGGERYSVVARVTSNRVRHGLLDLLGSYHSPDAPLTWSDHSFGVTVEEVQSESEFASEDAVKITCRGKEDHGRGGFAMTIGLPGGGSAGPAEQAKLWASRAILGIPHQSKSMTDLLGMETRPDSPTLPEVLNRVKPSGWLAEGLVRLYAVEESWRKCGARFEHLTVGPATAMAVSIDGMLVIESGFGGGRSRAHLQGTILLHS